MDDGQAEFGILGPVDSPDKVADRCDRSTIGFDHNVKTLDAGATCRRVRHDSVDQQSCAVGEAKVNSKGFGNRGAVEADAILVVDGQYVLHRVYFGDRNVSVVHQQLQLLRESGDRTRKHHGDAEREDLVRIDFHSISPG